MRRVLIKIGFISTLILGIVTGCEKREKVELVTGESIIEEDFGEASDSDATGDAYLDTTKETIPEHVTYEVTSSNGKITVEVDADIYGDSYKQMTVCKEEPATLSEEEIKALAESLFDGGKYEIKKPYIMMSINELEAEAQWWEDMFETHETPKNLDMLIYWEIQEIISDKESRPDKGASHEGDMVEGQLLYRIPDAEFSECYLEGEVDGETWTLRYRSNPYYLSFRPKVTVFGKYTGFEEFTEQSDINPCNYEDAKNEAFELLSSFGIDDMGLYDTKQLESYQNMNLEKNGYLFMFTKTVNGKDVGNASRHTLSIKPGEEKLVPQEYAVVAIDTTGVYFVEVYNRYNIVEQIGNADNMLPYSKVEQVFNEYVQQWIDTDDSLKGTVQFLRIRLGYLTVNCDGEYVLMPYWSYYNIIDWNECAMDWADTAINAIDGSVVYLAYGDNTRWMFGDGRMIPYIQEQEE